MKMIRVLPLSCITLCKSFTIGHLRSLRITQLGLHGDGNIAHKGLRTAVWPSDLRPGTFPARVRWSVRFGLYSLVAWRWVPGILLRGKLRNGTREYSADSNRHIDLPGLAIPLTLGVWPWHHTSLGPCGAHRDPLSSAPAGRRGLGSGNWSGSRTNCLLSAEGEKGRPRDRVKSLTSWVPGLGIQTQLWIIPSSPARVLGPCKLPPALGRNATCSRSFCYQCHGPH